MNPREPAQPQIGRLIKQAFHFSRRAVDDAVRVHGVSAAQWGVLNRLSEEPGLSGADLARQMFITPQAAQLALTTLEHRGLVERRPDPSHGRILRCYLTAAGKRLADVCRADAHAVETELMAGYSTEERRLFTDFLLRYMHGVGESPESPRVTRT